MEIKTPKIVEEVFGKKVYDKFEDYRKSLPEPNMNYTIITSSKVKEIFENKIKEEYGLSIQQGK